MAGKSSPEAMERMINNITKFIQVQQSVAPVSYTHLDVYKRQVLINGALLYCPPLAMIPYNVQNVNTKWIL